MTVVAWPWSQQKQAPIELPVETREIRCRTERLADKVHAMGRETRALAEEARTVRENNHFGPALRAVFEEPRRHA